MLIEVVQVTWSQRDPGAHFGSKRGI